MDEELRPARKREGFWYTPSGHAEPRRIAPEKVVRPRRKTLAHVTQYPWPSTEGAWCWRVEDPSVREGRDGVRRNGVVASHGVMADEFPSFMPHESVAATLVDFEDEDGRCPGELA